MPTGSPPAGRWWSRCATPGERRPPRRSPAEPMTGDWRGAWTAALDELELDVSLIETMLADEHRNAEPPPAALWPPPPEPGPLPLELKPRADEILTRQL